MIAIKVKMCKIMLPDEWLHKLVERYNITAEEALIRFRLLYDVGLFQSYNLDDTKDAAAGQQEMDEFMVRPSSETYPEAVWTRCLIACMENGPFVYEYDRRTGNSMAEVLKSMNSGANHINTKAQMDMFVGYVRRNVYTKALENPDQIIYL